MTGGAGFIGSHLVDRLLSEDGWTVTVVDNYDPFYSRRIKSENLARHVDDPRLRILEGDIRNPSDLARCAERPVDVIVHLAAKAGVRPSIQDPTGYQDNNIGGTQTLLEAAREWQTPQFVFASSSSVYGTSSNTPWSESDCVLRPISPYAATKVAGELLGHVYSHLYDMRFVALRYFTVYGPRQRPDLAIHKFARMILQGETIPVYGDGTSSRDYSFIDDIINGTRAAIDLDADSFEIINLGNDRTVPLETMIATIERTLGRNAAREYLPPQAGDVFHTWANITRARELLGYAPGTSFDEGLRVFVDWLQRER